MSPIPLYRLFLNTPYPTQGGIAKRLKSAKSIDGQRNFFPREIFLQETNLSGKKDFLAAKNIRLEKMTFLMRFDALKENLPTYCKKLSSKPTQDAGRHDATQLAIK